MQTPQILIVSQGTAKSLVSAGEGGMLRPAHLCPVNPLGLINLPSRGQTQLCKNTLLEFLSVSLFGRKSESTNLNYSPHFDYCKSLFLFFHLCFQLKTVRI